MGVEMGVQRLSSGGLRVLGSSRRGSANSDMTRSRGSTAGEQELEALVGTEMGVKSVSSGGVNEGAYGSISTTTEP